MVDSWLRFSTPMLLDAHVIFSMVGVLYAELLTALVLR
jgi:hypothetical protein